MTLRRTKRSRAFNGIYTVLCAVLRARWGKPHAGRMCVAPLAWLVQRSNIAHNVLQIGDRFVKRWHCAAGQTAANVLLGDRYFLCGGIYEY